MNDKQLEDLIKGYWYIADGRFVDANVRKVNQTLAELLQELLERRHGTFKPS